MKKYTLLSLIILIFSCSEKKKSSFDALQDVNLKYMEYTPKGNEIVISRAEYLNKLKGFWLAQCIANWTGLVTENDKIGNIGESKTGDFYTREDWGKKDELNLRGNSLDRNIDFVFEGKDGMWGADDDTDIEYLYQLYPKAISHDHQYYILSPWYLDILQFLLFLMSMNQGRSL